MMIISFWGYILFGILGVFLLVVAMMAGTAIYRLCTENIIVLLIVIGIIFGILAWLYFEVMGYGTPSVSVASITDPRILWDNSSLP